MAASKALQRLLQVRCLEEEQRRVALESALANLQRMKAASEACVERERRGRELIRTATETASRVAGRVELEAARKRSRLLSESMRKAECDAARLREAFLATRLERRQAETLIEEALSRQILALEHRTQQSLDEWHVMNCLSESARTRQNRQKNEEIVSDAAAAIPNRDKGFQF